MKKRQLIVIHGGDFYESRQKFFAALKKEGIEKEDLLPVGTKRWKDNLQSDLGEGFEVLAPKMPLAIHARYEEWKVWFDKALKFAEDGVTLVGHSLGGIFLARYLSENALPVRARALYLVAPYFSQKDKGADAISGWVLPKSLRRLENQVPKVSIYQSEDDKVVPLSHARRYAKLLPKAKLVIFKEGGHFRQEHFPELVRDIKSLV
ncbi:MAG: alpha/beta hydrolase [Candidatus Taylorbacteria bacterium]|nr:alpha/beta hydrolase [Candidatus Taylorbacteria bacterium]